ncbi:MAG: DUF3857 domain-containing protein, partial [Bacteroidota bacterium]
MSNRLIVIILTSLFYIPAKGAGGGEYAVSKIAPALLKNANAVLRLGEQRFEIMNPGKAVYRNHYVITILNENGDDWAECAEYYDKFQKIGSIEGILYNAAGDQLKKIKTKDAEDLSGVAESSLMDDHRLKRHNFYYRVYPYTIEYNIEIEYSSTLFFPKWVPQERELLSVEKSSMSIVSPPGYEFRYKTFNYTGTAVKSIEKDGKTATLWSAANMPAIVREIY